MSLDKTFISAISENDENIINNFINKASIKKSKLIREFIRALEGVDPENVEILVLDNKNLKSISLTEVNNKKSIIGKDLTKNPFEMNIKVNNEQNVIITKQWGDVNNV